MDYKEFCPEPEATVDKGDDREQRSSDDVDVSDLTDRFAREGRLSVTPLRGLSVDCRFKSHKRDEYATPPHAQRNLNTDAASGPDDDSTKDESITPAEGKVITGGACSDSLLFYTPSDFKRELGRSPVTVDDVRGPAAAVPKASASHGASALATIFTSNQPGSRRK